MLLTEDESEKIAHREIEERAALRMGGAG